MTDEALIKHILAGSTRLNTAVRWIYQESGWQEKISPSLKRLGAHKADIEDIFQEAICTLVFNIRDGKFRGDAKLSTYLSAITQNKWRTYYRKNQTLGLNRGNTILDISDEGVNSPEEDFLSNEQKSRLESNLDILGAKCQKILKLWALNYSMKEIANEMQYKSAGMARKKKHNCFQRLKTKITEDPYFNS